MVLWQEMAQGPSSGQRPEDRVCGQVWSWEAAPLSTVKQWIRDLSSAKRTQTASRQREQRPGTDGPQHLASFQQCRGAALQGGHHVRAGLQQLLRTRPSTDHRQGCGVGELQETRMLNYRAALETSNSSGTVARRGGSRAGNRKCGGSRREQSEEASAPASLRLPAFPSAPSPFPSRPESQHKPACEERPREWLGGSGPGGRAAARGAGVAAQGLLHQGLPPGRGSKGLFGQQGHRGKMDAGTNRPTCPPRRDCEMPGV